MIEIWFSPSMGLIIGKLHWRKTGDSQNTNLVNATWKMPRPGVKWLNNHFKSPWAHPKWKKQNIYYIKTIGEVVQFLAVNEMPLCGSLESTESQDDRHDFSAGLFLKMVAYTLNKDTKFNEINKTIPLRWKATVFNAFRVFLGGLNTPPYGAGEKSSRLAISAAPPST